EKARSATTELLALAPHVILANATAAVAASQRATRSVPIVFTGVSEPVAQGLVASLTHPGGNITGFTNLEPSVGAKWLELLKEIAPSVTRVAVMFKPALSQAIPLFQDSLKLAAPKFGVQLIEVLAEQTGWRLRKPWRHEVSPRRSRSRRSSSATCLSLTVSSKYEPPNSRLPQTATSEYITTLAPEFDMFFPARLHLLREARRRSIKQATIFLKQGTSHTPRRIGQTCRLAC